jgi:hypothetical protein
MPRVLPLSQMLKCSQATCYKSACAQCAAVSLQYCTPHKLQHCARQCTWPQAASRRVPRMSGGGSVSGSTAQQAGQAQQASGQVDAQLLAHSHASELICCVQQQQQLAGRSRQPKNTACRQTHKETTHRQEGPPTCAVQLADGLEESGEGAQTVRRVANRAHLQQDRLAGRQLRGRPGGSVNHVAAAARAGPCPSPHPPQTL